MGVKQCCPGCQSNEFVLLNKLNISAGPAAWRFAYSSRGGAAASSAVAPVSSCYVCCNPACPDVKDKALDQDDPELHLQLLRQLTRDGVLGQAPVPANVIAACIGLNRRTTHCVSNSGIRVTVRVCESLDCESLVVSLSFPCFVVLLFLLYCESDFVSQALGGNHSCSAYVKYVLPTFSKWHLRSTGHAGT